MEEVEVVEPIQHQVQIKLDKVHKIMFKSKKEKDEFMKSESLFCLKELKVFHAAIEKSDRKLYRHELNIKRMVHATQLGFKQLAKTGIWNRAEIDNILA